jgi:septation ring formation regulator EzrA
MSNVFTIPSSPEDRKKIRDHLSEISNSMTRIEAERDHINTILADLQDEYELPKKHMRKVSRVFHKQNINEVKEEFTDVEDIYNAVSS